MANGHFFGGVAEGITSARDDVRKNALLAVEQEGLGIRRDALAQQGAIANRELGLKEKGLSLEQRALGIKENALKHAQSQQALAAAEEAIAKTTEVAVKTADALRAGGRSPEDIRRAVTPYLVEVQSIGARIGRKPETYAHQFEQIVTAPTPVETATTAGKAALAKDTASTPPRAPGVLPGDATPDEKNRLSKMTTSWTVLDKELTNFEGLIKKHGVSLFPGTEERVVYDATRRNIQMQMKELYNLGVLNGPDLMLMDSMIIDPTVGRSVRHGESGVAKVADSVFQAASAPVQAMYKSALLQGSAKANISVLRNSMKTLFNANRDVIMRLPQGTSERETAGAPVGWETYFGKK